MDTKVRELPAVRSPILIVEGLGYGDDKVASGTRPRLYQVPHGPKSRHP